MCNDALEAEEPLCLMEAMNVCTPRSSSPDTNMLTRLKLVTEHLEEQNHPPLDCSICLEPLKTGKAFKLPCFHVFHQSCAALDVLIYREDPHVVRRDTVVCINLNADDYQDLTPDLLQQHLHHCGSDVSTSLSITITVTVSVSFLSFSFTLHSSLLCLR